MKGNKIERKERLHMNHHPGDRSFLLLFFYLSPSPVSFSSPYNIFFCDGRRLSLLTVAVVHCESHLLVCLHFTF